MNTPSLSISKNSITAIFKSSSAPLCIRNDSFMWNHALEAVKTKNWADLRECFNLKNAIKLYSKGAVDVIEGGVLCNGKSVVGYIKDTILSFLKDGLPIDPILAFLENVSKNPNEISVNDLYTFLEKNQIPITEDGCFLAYKNVQLDYYSHRQNPDGTRNRNKIGDVVKQDRETVCADRNIVCAPGLHFCSFEYLSHYFGSGQSRTMVVSINPKNVVSIPTDYNNAKGRCCEYTVVDEVPNEFSDKHKDSDIFVKSNLFTVCKDGVKRYNHRISGKFAKKV